MFTRFLLLSSIILSHKHLVHPFTCLTRPLVPLFTRFLFAIIYYPFSQASCPLVNLFNSSTNTLIKPSNSFQCLQNWKELERVGMIDDLTHNSEFTIHNSQLFERSSHQYVTIHNYDYRCSESSKLKG